jgi:phosphohistidine phosphatase
MKKIILVRHGKAEDDSPEFSDFERSLTPKGKLVSRLMAHKLKAKEHSPGAIVTSPAFRALETALIFAGEYGINPEDIIMKSNIYHGLTMKNLPEILSSVNEETESITLFGHNPSFSDLANGLSKEGCDSMPKSGVACISFNIATWSEIARNKGKLEYFLKPSKHDE